MTSILEGIFKLRKNNTNIRTEFLAGITTFMTMAYILAVNPSILSITGMNPTAILMATALASFVGCFAMALLANYPFALAPGMGLNAFFAFTICGSMGYSWQFALFAVFLEGIIFIILSLTSVRQMLFDSIPMSLKRGVAIGLGLFIAFIGLQNGKVVCSDPATLVCLTDFSKNFSTTGICATLALLGTILTFLLYTKKIPGAILLGIMITWLVGIVCQLVGIYKATPDQGFYSLIPSWATFDLSAIGQTFGQCFSFGTMKFSLMDTFVIVFALLFIDIFDTLGTLTGCATKSHMLDANGSLPRVKQALLADAVATTAGAVLGTSTTTTFAESATGISVGGRTGLTAAVVGILFLLMIFFAPIFTAIPGFATAPALVLVGFFMLSPIQELDMGDLCESVPAYLCMLMMPMTYSISIGIGVGIISYVLINLFCGKFHKISLVMYILAILFILKFILT